MLYYEHAKTNDSANFDKITNKIRDSAKVVAEISMNNAAAELKEGSQGIVDIGVTVDGTWQHIHERCCRCHVH